MSIRVGCITPGVQVDVREDDGSGGGGGGGSSARSVVVSVLDVVAPA